VTITDISVSVGGGPASQIDDDTDDGSTGAGNREVFVDDGVDGVGSDTGFVERNGGFDLETTQGFDDLADVAAAESGDNRLQVTIADFEKSNGDDESVAGRQVTVTLTFSDGSTTQFSFTA